MEPRKVVNEMRALAAALAVAAMLAVPLGLMGTATDAGTNRDLTPVVIGPVSTDRFGGGDLVAVKAGDAVFGVRYGTSAYPNDIVIFAEYKRFLGGAQIVDEQGNILATRGIPVYTVFAQSLNRFIEFREVNTTEGFDLMSLDPLHTSLSNNTPVKGLLLRTAWQLGELTNETVGDLTYVNFTVSATDLAYTRVLDYTNLGDGMLNRLAFTFHLVVRIHEVSADVPWYRVTVDDGNRYDITNVAFLGYRNVTGPAVAMGAKYDHNITGWDFAYPGDKLALETQLLYGNYIPERTAEFIHDAFLKDRADDGNDTLGNATTLNETAPTRPILYTRDRVYFDDTYTRIGRFEWVTDVKVDGVDEPTGMSFNIQGGGRLLLYHNGAYFVGFWLRAAFVYPDGQTIQHDPALAAEAFVDLPSSVNLTPLTILAAQLAVVAIAMGPALYLRAKARRQP